MTDETRRILSAIGYIPFLFFVPLYFCKDSEECKFHGRQSLILLLVYIILSLSLWLISVIFKFIFGNIPLLGFLFKFLGWLLHNFLGGILGFVYIILVIVCIIFTLSGTKWEIPIIAKYAKTTNL
ncbi:MAG: hypothetical protein NZ601_06090 [candidate division WOR-3 bacterium]|nr:hypothetical protein [candidate division WOR-3 bacterium]MCX7757445.1 hypothetical protein [candidate division WOR-3 bacterium]MDW7988114.1 hypothetical protein [candidate division WOR-3 bacterium]